MFVIDFDKLEIMILMYGVEVENNLIFFLISNIVN